MPLDLADIAQEQIETTLEHKLARRSTLTIPFSGFCLSCSEPVGQQRYCDADCRCNHEALLRRRMIDPNAR